MLSQTIQRIKVDSPALYTIMFEPMPIQLESLIGIQQDINHHPEGSAFVHTVYTVNAMLDIIKEQSDLYLVSSQETTILLLAALCHDFGKATTTVIHEDGRITAYGHDDAGIEPTRALLDGALLDDSCLISYVVPLVKEHMAHVSFKNQKITKRAVRRLARKLMPATIEQWALLVEADYKGRPPKEGLLPKEARDILFIAQELGINNGYKENAV